MLAACSVVSWALSGNQTRWRLYWSHQNSTFDIPEIQCAVDRLKNGRAADTKGIRAEMLKNCDTDTKELICDTSNMVIDQETQPPLTWKQTTSKVTYNKGDPTEPTSYVPSARYNSIQLIQHLGLLTADYTRSLTDSKCQAKVASEMVTRRHNRQIL